MVFAIISMGCSTKQKTGQQLPTGDNARTSLDWPGMYVGVLPCADCEGILTEIQLRADNTYDLATQYLGKSKEIHRKKGAIKWDASGNFIRLVGADSPSGDLRYQVQENALLQLDKDGKRIEGEQADLYRIAKHDAATDIREKYWKLIELYGQPIEMTKGHQREPHIILKFSGRVIGSTGCNRLMGSYTTEDGNRIRFSRMASTLMACSDVPHEEQFLRMFEGVDNYTMQNDTLALYKGRTAAHARFVAVYLH